MSEDAKDKLRGALKYFDGDKNNINVQIKIDKQVKNSRPIYLTDDILLILKDIIGEENIILKEI